MAASSTHVTDQAEERVEATVHQSSSQTEEQRDADLYAPPAYTIQSTAGEERLDAEAFVPEKTTLLVDVQSEPYPSPSYTLENVDTREETLTPSQSIPARKPVEWSRSSENAIMCSVLPDRVATWTVKKNRGMALCPLAAAVLVRAGILSNEDLLLTRALLERSRPSSPLNPTDPVSAVLVSTFDALGDVLLGVAGGPLEVAQQFGPARHAKKSEDRVRQSQNPLSPRGGSGSRDDTLMAGPKALVHYFNGTYKGVRKIVETGIKVPMTYSYSLTRGFHNMPRLYGERLREHGEVVDLKTGLVISGKAFGFGVYDGLKDFFVMPVKGVQKEGFVGAGKGFCKGVGNALGNFGEAGCGLIGYSSYGIYKELKKSSMSDTVSTRNAVLTLGEAEVEQMSQEERRNITKRWLQVQMRLGLRGS